MPKFDVPITIENVETKIIKFLVRAHRIERVLWYYLKPGFELFLFGASFLIITYTIYLVENTLWTR